MLSGADPEFLNRVGPIEYLQEQVGETGAPWTLFFCLEFWHVCLTIKFPLGMPMLGNLSNLSSYIAV